MRYRAVQASGHGITVARLADLDQEMEVSVMPSIGNLAYEVTIHGSNILYFPYGSAVEFQEKPVLSGIPFLAPWANRLDPQGFWANGREYAFDMNLGNIWGALPIHGLLAYSPHWQVTALEADSHSARLTSRLEFYKFPELMAQWPIAHEYAMTYQLSKGALEVSVTVTNRSTEPMPVAIGFHPYVRIPGVPRDDWNARIPARRRVVADERLIPTGEYCPSGLNGAFPLKGCTFDDGFTDLIREADGLAHFLIESDGKKIEIQFGPKYRASVVWAPRAGDGKPRDFVCFEPMAGITNALNLHHEGKYPELQSLEPGADWTESFWIKPDGF